MSRPQGLFAAYVPGTSVVHRAPLAAKFLLVVAVSATTFLVTDWRWALAVLLGVLGVHAASGLGARRLVTSLRPLALLLVVLFAFQWWSRDAEVGARVVLGILASFVAAGLLTATTPMEEIIDGVVAAARPVRRLVDPEVLGLAIAVMLRSIPWVTGAFSDVRDAARARGLDRSLRAHLLPVVIHTVAYARSTGDALAAWGLGDDPETPPGGDREPQRGA